MRKKKETEMLLPFKEGLTPSQRRYLAVGKGYVHANRVRAPDEASSRVFCNASQTDVYRAGDGDPFHQVMRPGAERARALPSKGIG